MINAADTLKPDYELFDEHSQAIVYNLMTDAIQRMLEFDHVCGRKIPSVAGVVTEGRDSFEKFFWGTREILIPTYPSIEAATRACPNADVVINFMSFRSAYTSTMDCLEIPNIRTVVIIAEGVPERYAREMTAKAKKLGKWIIGPATVGGIVPGKFKIGNTGGTLENIIDSRLHRPGSIGFVSVSGGMSNECYNIINRNSNGIYEGIAIGGDKYPGTDLLDHLLRYEKNPNIKMLVSLGEIGGEKEYQIVEALKKKMITKPLVIWVTGTSQKMFPGEVQFGHAGAKADSNKETAEAKNAALKAAGAVVPNSFDDFDDKIKETYQKLVEEGVIEPAPEPPIPIVPLDFAKAVKAGTVRRPASFVSTISDDRGDEVTYNGIPLSQVINDGMGIGGVLSLLWFKRKMPEYGYRYIELVIQLTGDHGPAVSGAHNASVAARAGKDLMSSLCAGILTIGPRFGGAISDAAIYFRKARDSGQTPKQFVDEMKGRGINIPGIGHLIKSVNNPEVRVEILKQFVYKNFSKHTLLDYALEVEKLTTEKKDTLILNVDGGIGVCFVDFMESSGVFTMDEVQQYLELGVLNGLFVLGRSIGMIGHIIDQQRNKQGLYRTPFDEIAYMTPEQGYPEHGF